ncbi:MAG: methyltransferase domain-containing protein [Pseudonocardiales bacterium]|nr:methyltransferase domain-containing protein [Pseudonocardiales bacterium]
MNTATADWAALATRLADELTERGVLHDPTWRAALLAVPRHELVPRHFTQDGPDAGWHEITGIDPTTREDWLAAVYANTALITALSEDNNQVDAASSSSQPSLMIRMLEALEITDGNRMLEIGTGTGYNAALLSHRLGARNVYSIDIDGQLVDQARERLAHLGYRPALACGDGADGWPDHAPYDRILATCSVPAVPWAWAQQTAQGGRVLVDLKTGTNAGNLVLLHRHPDRLEGRFLPKWAGFMAIRHHQQTPAAPSYPHRDAATARTRTTTVSPQPWDNLVVWFLAQFHQPAELSFGLTLDETTHQPTATFLAATDGSWCEIDHHSDNGHHQLREAGPSQLWRSVENAYQDWEQTGRPGWDRLGLTVTAHEQRVWLDTPNNTEHAWQLMPIARPH